MLQIAGGIVLGVIALAFLPFIIAGAIWLIMVCIIPIISVVVFSAMNVQNAVVIGLIVGVFINLLIAYAKDL